jgi:hypothetical protein
VAGILLGVILPGFLFALDGRGTDWAEGWSETFSLGDVSAAIPAPLATVDETGNLYILRLVRGVEGEVKLILQMTPDYQTFSPPRTLAFPSEQPYALQGAMDSLGTFHLVWISAYESTRAVFYGALDLKNLILSAPRKLSKETTRLYSPTVFVDIQDRVHLAWVEQTGSECEIFYARFSAGSEVPTAHPMVVPMSGIHFAQLVVDEEAVWIAWTAREGLTSATLPDEEVVYVGALTLGGETVLHPRWVGVRERSSFRPFCLIGSRGLRVPLLLMAGWDHPVRAQASYGVHLWELDSEKPEKPIRRALFVSGAFVGDPVGVVRSDGTVSLAWVQADGAFLDIWVGHLPPGTEQVVVEGRLSPHDRGGYLLPRLLEDDQGGLHAFWFQVETSEGQKYRLMYRNTVHPEPIGFWRRIGVPEKSPLSALLFAGVYALGIAPWMFVIFNLHNIILAFLFAWGAQRFIFRRAFKRHPYFSIWLLFSLLFLLFTPINPGFVQNTFASLTLTPLWFTAAAFLLASGICLWILKRSEWEQGDLIGLIGGTLLWTASFGFLSGLPGVIQAVSRL